MRRGPLTGAAASLGVARGDCDGRGRGETFRTVWSVPMRRWAKAMAACLHPAASWTECAAGEGDGRISAPRVRRVCRRRAGAVAGAREEPRAHTPTPHPGQRPSQPAGSASLHFRSPAQGVGVRLRARLSPGGSGGDKARWAAGRVVQGAPGGGRRGGAERRRRRRELRCSAVRGDAPSRRAELDGPLPAAVRSFFLGRGWAPRRATSSARSPEARGAPPAAPRVSPRTPEGGRRLGCRGGLRGPAPAPIPETSRSGGKGPSGGMPPARRAPLGRRPAGVRLGRCGRRRERAGEVAAGRGSPRSSRLSSAPLLLVSLADAAARGGGSSRGTRGRERG